MRTPRWIFEIGVLLVALLLLAAPGASAAQVAVSITIGPPPLPVYAQPLCPAEGFIWIPGYWAYGPEGYFWVPGMWAQPPVVGYLWTPGYWDWDDGAYIWYPGYWGPEVGFYGGIDYGFGYFGSGYEGGYWNQGRFYYNTAVNHVNVTVVRYTYDRPEVNRTTVNYISYNGGPGGVAARPTHQEEALMHASHRPPTSAQREQEQTARANRSLLASVNHGRPTIAATAKAGEFRGRGVVGAETPGRGGARALPARPNAAPERGRAIRSTVPRDAPPPRANEHPSRDRRANPPENANPQLERQRQQEMRRQQDQERQRQEQQRSQQRSNERQQEEMQRQHRQQMEQRQQREPQQRQRQENRQRPEKPSEKGQPSSPGR